MIDGRSASSLSAAACAGEAQPRLGFHGGGAHRGHRGQERAGIGRGVVEESRRSRRSRMQRLGVWVGSSSARASTAMRRWPRLVLETNKVSESGGEGEDLNRAEKKAERKP
jgi:hypothetical protein